MSLEQLPVTAIVIICSYLDDLDISSINERHFPTFWSKFRKVILLQSNQHSPPRRCFSCFQHKLDLNEICDICQHTFCSHVPNPYHETLCGYCYANFCPNCIEKGLRKRCIRCKQSLCLADYNDEIHCKKVCQNCLGTGPTSKYEARIRRRRQRGYFDIPLYLRKRLRKKNQYLRNTSSQKYHESKFYTSRNCGSFFFFK